MLKILISTLIYIRTLTKFIKFFINAVFSVVMTRVRIRTQVRLESGFLRTRTRLESSCKNLEKTRTRLESLEQRTRTRLEFLNQQMTRTRLESSRWRTRVLTLDVFWKTIFKSFPKFCIKFKKFNYKNLDFEIKIVTIL